MSLCCPCTQFITLLPPYRSERIRDACEDLQNIFEYDVLVFLQEMVCDVGVMFHVLLNPVDTILIPECIHPHRSFTFEPCQQGEY
jgi:hypothetical protein